MLEILAGKQSKKKEEYLLDISFADAAIGTKTITDKAKGFVLTPVGVTTGDNFGVIDHPVAGRCFQFDGNAHFYNAPCPMGNFGTSSYDFEIGFVKPNSILQVLFGTGYYGSYMEDGWSLTLNQFADPIQIQVFCMPSGARQYFSGSNTYQFIELVIEKRANEIRMINKATGAVVKNAVANYTGDTYLSVGGEHSAVSRFTGFLKYARIKKVVE